MPPLPPPSDPTLEAIDRAMVTAQERRHFNRLGASRIGNPCERALWYEFRWASLPEFDAQTLRNFADGHQAEAMMAMRLRLVETIEVWSHDGAGRQYEFIACEGHFVCRPDGVILGLLQAPKTPHAWDHKSSAKMTELQRHITTLGEKAALRAWNEVYYAQALIEMHLADVTRHYLTCSTPGGRQTIACRTEANQEEALRLLTKARRVIEARNAPARISETPSFYSCRFCDHAPICHDDRKPLVNCRTCLHSTPIDGGGWHCEHWGKMLSTDDQKAACPAHLYIPSMINGEQIDAAADGSWVSYRMPDGSEWRDGVKG